MGRIEETYKAKDVEEIIDIHLYRPWGYALAVLARALRMTPNQISVVGMVVGIAAGHLFYYESIPLNLLGIFLWALAQALDGADGQLARMTDMKSQLGRMLDGISDNVKFISVYAHLGARLAGEFSDPWPILLVFVAMLMHSYQSALADYYRNAYLFFVYGSGKAEIEDVGELDAQYESMRWSDGPATKFLLYGSIGYAMRQARMVRRSTTLRQFAIERLGREMPESVREAYRRVNKPLLRYYNALTTNTRMVVLYVLLLTGHVVWFFAFELVVLNAVMLLLWGSWQRSADRRIHEFIGGIEPAQPAVPAAAVA